MELRQELLGLARELRLRVRDSSREIWRMPVAEESAVAVLDKLKAEITACRKCSLGMTRLKAVPGVGSYEAQVMFVGEGPGFQEDHDGEPFVTLCRERGQSLHHSQPEGFYCPSRKFSLGGQDSCGNCPGHPPQEHQQHRPASPAMDSN